ncbi:MAG: cobyrinate a,c-diamide synthase [Rhodobacteraceae bacterium]|nr:cobyrinate a,c-diamide synthase [Paracoccaceae bacterium]
MGRDLVTQRRSILIAAPASNSGKTTVTLGLLRHLSKRGIRVRAAKSGPDYIDPLFHQAACGLPSVNLDAWAMPGEVLIAAATTGTEKFLIIEGAMGVLDGAGRQGTGSAADLAEILGVPVILVIDAARLGHSAILPALGLQSARPGLVLAGIIANRVASLRHQQMITAAAEAHGLTLLGCIHRNPALELPSRHLGLVPPHEHPGLEAFLDAAAQSVGSSLRIAGLLAAAAPLPAPTSGNCGIAPPGQRIAIARDQAFCFLYTHLVANWRRQGAEPVFFSPLNDEAPDAGADAVFLPGGYPELHAGRLAACLRFRAGMQALTGKGAVIYGECGGFMVLGEGIEDSDGHHHAMTGLLNHSTSFQHPRLQLGYRSVRAAPGAPFEGSFAAHEFHYAAMASASASPPLFHALDADGAELRPMGAIRGNVSGSFAHLICASSRYP